MKFVLSILAIFAIGFATSLRAQEESPEPSASVAPDENKSPIIEAPSTLRETSPAPSPAAKKASATSSEAKKKETTAEASASPTAEKKASASAKTEKTSTAAASTGPDKGSPESNVKRLENEWEAAIMKHDAAFAEARIAKDYIGFSSKNKRQNKADIMKELKADGDTYTSAKNSGMTVKPLGKEVAVAMGVAKEVGKAKDGKAFNRSYAWTDTWALRDGQWQCVASHVTQLSSK